LDHKIDTDAIWTEIPRICPNHKLPCLRAHPEEKRERPGKKRDVKEISGVPAGNENKDPKCKNIKIHITHVTKIYFYSNTLKLPIPTLVSHPSASQARRLKADPAKDKDKTGYVRVTKYKGLIDVRGLLMTYCIPNIKYGPPCTNSVHRVTQKCEHGSHLPFNRWTLKDQCTFTKNCLLSEIYKKAKCCSICG
jgi:hypothetical protein